MVQICFRQWTRKRDLLTGLAFEPLQLKSAPVRIYFIALGSFIEQKNVLPGSSPSQSSKNPDHYPISLIGYVHVNYL